MNGFDTSLTTETVGTTEAATLQLRDATAREIAAGVARGKRMRAEALARFGHKVGLTISSLWRRPGRLLPAAAQ
ncbi:MAG: hypothetical protein P9C36_00090 [Defluviicoccus sp.]|nr:hypothetical protein [Defluviicoccus sp.]